MEKKELYNVINKTNDLDRLRDIMDVLNNDVIENLKVRKELSKKIYLLKTRKLNGNEKVKIYDAKREKEVILDFVSKFKIEGAEKNKVIIETLNSNFPHSVEEILKNMIDNLMSFSKYYQVSENEKSKK